MDVSTQGPKITASGDSRITSEGRFLRKYKLDELPQLFNVLVGDMSFVGPRPEVEMYTKLYSNEDREVFCVRPGITDLASLKYSNENEILQESINPEETYINEILPDKIKLNREYIKKQSLFLDIRIILATIFGRKSI